MNDPKLVLQSVIDNNDTSENNISIFPLTIQRYCYLELIESPFLDQSKKMTMGNIIPTAFVMSLTPQQLKKYTSKNIDDLVFDAMLWADSNLKLGDVPELVNVIVGQMNALNKAAEANSGGDGAGVEGKKKSSEELTVVQAKETA